MKVNKQLCIRTTQAFMTWWRIPDYSINHDQNSYRWVAIANFHMHTMWMHRQQCDTNVALSMSSSNRIYMGVSFCCYNKEKQDTCCFIKKYYVSMQITLIMMALVSKTMTSWWIIYWEKTNMLYCENWGKSLYIYHAVVTSILQPHVSGGRHSRRLAAGAPNKMFNPNKIICSPSTITSKCIL